MSEPEKVPCPACLQEVEVTLDDKLVTHDRNPDLREVCDRSGTAL